MSTLTDFIEKNLIETTYGLTYYEGITEPNAEQLSTMKRLIEDALDRIYFPHCYEDE